MTAKSRRRKIDKRRKSDEHPHPRRTEDSTGRDSGVKILRQGRLVNASLVAEPGPYGGRIEFTDISPEAFDIIAGDQLPFVARGVGDHGELTVEGFSRQRALEEGLRSSGASDAATAVDESGARSVEDVLGAILDAKEQLKKPETGFGRPGGF